jgi:hypothetical protein
VIFAADIVHYVLRKGPHAGECRPAALVRRLDLENGVVKVHVFIDLDVDTSWAGSDEAAKAVEAIYDDGRKPGTWHHGNHE